MKELEDLGSTMDVTIVQDAISLELHLTEVLAIGHKIFKQRQNNTHNHKGKQQKPTLEYEIMLEEELVNPKGKKKKVV